MSFNELSSEGEIPIEPSKSDSIEHKATPDYSHGKISKDLNDFVPHRNTIPVSSDAGPKINDLANNILHNLAVLPSLPALPSLPSLPSLPDRPRTASMLAPNEPPKIRNVSEKIILGSRRAEGKFTQVKPTKEDLEKDLEKAFTKVQDDAVTVAKLQGSVDKCKRPEEKKMLEQKLREAKLTFAKSNVALALVDIGMESTPEELQEKRWVLKNLENEVMRIESEIKNHTPGEIGKNLIFSAANGARIFAPEFLAAAEDLKKEAHRSDVDTTTMHLLFEKAAEKFLEAGNMEAAFSARAAAADAVKFSSSHQLYNMTPAIEEGVSNQAIRDVGLHMESGSSRISGGLAFSTRPHLDGKPRDVLDCDLSSAARIEFKDKFGQIFGTYNSTKNKFENDHLKQFENSLPKHLRPVKITYKNGDKANAYMCQGKDANGKFTADPSKGIQFPTSSYEIEFGKGRKFIIGASTDYGAIYKHIRLEIPAGLPSGEGLKEMQQILTVLGLGPVISKERQVDDERRKLELMMQVHAPQGWDKLQKGKKIEAEEKLEKIQREEEKRLAEIEAQKKAEKIARGEKVVEKVKEKKPQTEAKSSKPVPFKPSQMDHFELSAADLKQKMIEIEPQMKEKFEMYEENPDLVTKIEVFPGKRIYALEDVADDFEKAGMYGLFAGTTINGAFGFLNTGPLSTDERVLSATAVKDGKSFYTDKQTEGSGGIFFRGVNKIVSENPISSKKFEYVGEVQVLMKNRIVNRGGVCYNQDEFGSRNDHSPFSGRKFKAYANRQSFSQFAKTLGTAIDKFTECPNKQWMTGMKNFKGMKMTEDGVWVHDDDDDPDTKGLPVKDPSRGAVNEICVDGGNIHPSEIAGLMVQDIQAFLRAAEERGDLENIIRGKDKDGKIIIIDAILVYNKAPGEKELRAPINKFIHESDIFEPEFFGIKII